MMDYDELYDYLPACDADARALGTIEVYDRDGDLRGTYDQRDSLFHACYVPAAEDAVKLGEFWVVDEAKAAIHGARVIDDFRSPPNPSVRAVLPGSASGSTSEG